MKNEKLWCPFGTDHDFAPRSMLQLQKTGIGHVGNVMTVPRRNLIFLSFSGEFLPFYQFAQHGISHPCILRYGHSRSLLYEIQILRCYNLLREGCRIFSTAPVQLCEATGCPLTNAVKGGTIGNRNAA